MKILVCVKPMNLGEEVKLSPFDLYAIEVALKVKDKTNGEVTALAMGEDKAKEIILESMSIGVDKGFLLNNKKFEKSDIIAKTKVLGDAIKKVGDFDLIVTGRDLDGGSLNVILEGLGKELGYEKIHNVLDVEGIEENSICVNRRISDKVEKLKINGRACISVLKSDLMPRFPNYLDLVRSENYEVQTIDLNDIDDEKIGIRGSKVIKRGTYKYVSKEKVIDFNSLSGDKGGEVWEGDLEDLSERLKEKLKSLKAF